MTFFCHGCDKDKDFFQDFVLLVVDGKGQEVRRFCRDCRKPKGGLPDVYFDGKPEENLADDPVTGQPRVFFSKGQKAQYLKERGLMEAGDRVHGAPVQLSQNQNGKKVDSKHDVKMALKRVKEMGQLARRQEYLRITKEGERHAKR